MEGLSNPDPDFRIKAELCIFQGTVLELIISLHFYPERQALFTTSSKMQKLRLGDITGPASLEAESPRSPSSKIGSAGFPHAR